ncbi:MAG: ATP-binding protein [Gammaproteobacteria bacterium]|nr:ATP-binding protein [Gammaproteobacteria bacterium]
MNWSETSAAVWRQQKQVLRPVMELDPVALDDLVGIDRQKAELVKNTQRFVASRPANNALLWGARGTGKSSLIKAVFNAYRDQGLRLIEVYKNDLQHLPDIVDEIRNLPQRFVIYCDDFSFEPNEHSYIALKTILEGSIEKTPDNVILYVTSNRRHLVPESMGDNLASRVGEREIHYSDAIEEKISLSDRFGLWLSFYQPNIEEYLAIVDSYFPQYPGSRQVLHEAALDFARIRASRSGRTARQFFNAFFDG